MSGIKGKWWGFVAKNRIHQCLQWTVHFFSLSRNSANLGPLSRPVIRTASNMAFQQISVYLPSCFCRIREALGWRRILKKLRGFTPNNWCPCLQWTVHFFQLTSQFGSLWPPFTPHYNVKKNWVGLAKHDFVDIEMRGEMGGKIEEITRQVAFKMFIFEWPRDGHPGADFRGQLKKMYSPS